MRETTVTIFGCGYVGKRLAGKLLQQSINVNAHVASPPSAEVCSQLGIQCVITNLDEKQAPVRLSGQKMIYLVPPPRTGIIDSRLTHLLDAIATAPEKFVLLSTTGVYGNCDGAWINEDTPINPSVDRARRRADAEQQAKTFCEHRDIPLVILRVAGIYGPDKIPLARIKSGEPIVNQQDSPYTNRIHAFDLVNICAAALLDKSITGTYNVTDGHPGTMYEYFNGIADSYGLPRPPAISLQQAQSQLSAGMLSYMAESRRIDNRKLLHDFGITLQCPGLQQGLKMLD